MLLRGERQDTLAAARLQIGILFSSVNKEKRSSAAAMKIASVDTVVVFVAFWAFLTAGSGAADRVEAEAAED